MKIKSIKTQIDETLMQPVFEEIEKLISISSTQKIYDE